MELKFNPDIHEYSVDGKTLPSITQILSAEGLINTDWYTEEGCRRGTIVHAITHLYDIGELIEDEVDQAYLPYLEAYKKWKEETGFMVRDSEVPRYHKTYKYAGTPDKVGEFRKYISVVEIKSGQVEPWIVLQSAAQAELVKQDYNVSLVKRYELQLRPDGTYRMDEHTSRQDQGIWLAALSCYQWKKLHLNGRK